MLYLAGALGIHLNSPWTGCCFAENLSSRRLLISHYSLDYFHPIKILITDPAKHLVPPAQKHFASCLQYSDRSLLAETSRADIFLSEWLYFRFEDRKVPIQHGRCRYRGTGPKLLWPCMQYDRLLCRCCPAISQLSPLRPPLLRRTRAAPDPPLRALRRRRISAAAAAPPSDRPTEKPLRRRLSAVSSSAPSH